MDDDYFKARLDQMIDLQHPLALLAKRLPWDAIEARITPLLTRKNRPGYSIKLLDLFGSHQQLVAAGPSAAGRKRLSVRLMVSLLYLKYTYNESDEGLCQRWSQDVYFQFFSGLPSSTVKRRKLLICMDSHIKRSITTTSFGDQVWFF